MNNRYLRPNEKFYVMGRYKDGSNIVAYQVRSSFSGETARVLKDELVQLCLDDRVTNCKAVKSNNEYTLSGVGCQLKNLPTVDDITVIERRKEQERQEQRQKEIRQTQLKYQPKHIQRKAEQEANKDSMNNRRTLPESDINSLNELLNGVLTRSIMIASGVFTREKLINSTKNAESITIGKVNMKGATFDIKVIIGYDLDNKHMTFEMTIPEDDMKEGTTKKDRENKYTKTVDDITKPLLMSEISNMVERIVRYSEQYAVIHRDTNTNIVNRPVMTRRRGSSTPISDWNTYIDEVANRVSAALQANKCLMYKNKSDRKEHRDIETDNQTYAKIGMAIAYDEVLDVRIDTYIITSDYVRANRFNEKLEIKANEGITSRLYTVDGDPISVIDGYLNGPWDKAVKLISGLDKQGIEQGIADLMQSLHEYIYDMNFGGHMVGEAFEKAIKHT